MISIALCDDEEHLLYDLKDRIATYMKRKAACFDIQLFFNAEQLLCSNSRFDLIFLDIQMSEMNGMEAAQKLRDHDKECFIVFITAFKQYVFDSFTVDASNYLLKPLSEEKLIQTLDKIFERLSYNEKQYFMIRKGQAFLQIRYMDILYCEVMKRKIYIHMKKEIIDYYDTIDNLQKNLTTEFFRCHRSYLINLRYVKRYDNNNAVMENHDIIPVSRLRQPEFVKAILEKMKNER